MDEIKLFPHNEEAYKKLIECLKTNQMVSINHATGTGKSFIILKYLCKNKNKRILYLAPTYPIIDQFMETHTKELGIDIKKFNRLDSLIYSNLLNENIEQLAEEYDIIILDEYHRCGAPKWGKKVNELLEIFKKKYPEKKVIGTTATEIRFLDNEKNMNNILFDGVCASRLSLADAILKGILPIPVYVNVIYELYEILDTIEKKVLKKCFYKKNIDKYLDIILDLRLQLDKIMSQFRGVEQTYLNGGKFLVFSNKIDNIDKDKNIINNIFKGNINSNFEVHSKQTKLQNKIILNRFKEQKEGNNFLYSINILNEGLHVKDIDAIFMFRKTTSPIIYFQQLGRLLSCSKKKDRVYVFDFVNNIKNHPYIYMLYQEVFRRANELILSEPQNKEFYQNILDKFKIINLTSNICEEVDNLVEQTKVDKLKEERINTAILIFEGKISSTFAEKIQAQIDIFKLKNSIDLKKFKKIKELNIRKPKIFDLTIDEYSEYLSDEKIRKEYDKEHKDSDLMGVPNHILFGRYFEIILRKIEMEMKKFKTKEEYIDDLYFNLSNFIKENTKSPEYNKRFSNNVDLETELFVKKIIFYNDLEKKGYIDKLNDLERNMIKGEILQKFFNFSFSHNGELPSLKSDDKEEVTLAKEFQKIEPYLNETEINLIKSTQEKHLLRVKEIITSYINFIKKYKRYPLKDSNDLEEKNLFESYIRCEEYFTKEEKQLIKDIFNSINKKEIMKNTYLEMLKKRR